MEVAADTGAVRYDDQQTAQQTPSRQPWLSKAVAQVRRQLSGLQTGIMMIELLAHNTNASLRFLKPYLASGSLARPDTVES